MINFEKILERQNLHKSQFASLFYISVSAIDERFAKHNRELFDANYTLRFLNTSLSKELICRQPDVAINCVTGIKGQKNSILNINSINNNTVITTREMYYLTKLLAEKDAVIAEKERIINLLLKNQDIKDK